MSFSRVGSCPFYNTNFTIPNIWLPNVIPNKKCCKRFRVTDKAKEKNNALKTVNVKVS